MNTETQLYELRPYQKEDVKFLTKQDCAGCFNEQRTGKTPTALMCIKERNLEHEKILIITTTSAIYQWQEEYEKWVGEKCNTVEGTPKKKQEIIENWTRGLVISMGSFKSTKASEGQVSAILAKAPKMVILDEAHQIRNSSTCAAESIFKLTKIPLRLALTGTPAYGKAADIYSIMHFLYPDTFKSKYRFQQEYLQKEEFIVYTTNGPRTVIKYDNFAPGMEKKLQIFLKNRCTQRKRKDVMKWLPEKDRITIPLPLTKQQSKYLKELSEVYKTEDLSTKGTLDRLVRYRQICLDPELVQLPSKSPKTEWIINFIEENPDTPLLIFSNFTQYIIRLFTELKERNIKEAMITGDVDAERRARYQKHFQEGRFNVLLINTMSGKEALTLDRAEVIIFTDVYPPIGAVEQAEDRFVATTEDKKDKPHTVFYLTMKDSFDEHVLRLLRQRKSETDIINDFKKYI